jgi:hypothetical protein
LSVLYSIEGIQQLLRWLQPLFDLLEIVLTFVLSLIGRLLEPIMIWLIDHLAVLLEGILGNEENPITLQPPAIQEFEQGEAPAYLHTLQEVFRYVCFGGVFLVALAIILFVVPARRRRRKIDETRESIWDEQDLMGDLADALRRGAGRLRDLGQMVRDYGLGRVFFDAVSVRRAYIAMCRLAAQRGFPRADAQTPYEYLRVLPQAFPGHADDVRVITEAYVQVHYGELPASSEEWEQVRTSWERVRESDAPVAEEKVPPESAADEADDPGEADPGRTASGFGGGDSLLGGSGEDEGAVHD